MGRTLQRSATSELHANGDQGIVGMRKPYLSVFNALVSHVLANAASQQQQQPCSAFIRCKGPESCPAMKAQCQA